MSDRGFATNLAGHRQADGPNLTPN